jgi:hypothetical protein
MGEYDPGPTTQQLKPGRGPAGGTAQRAGFGRAACEVPAAYVEDVMGVDEGGGGFRYGNLLAFGLFRPRCRRSGTHRPTGGGSPRRTAGSVGCSPGRRRVFRERGQGLGFGSFQPVVECGRCGDRAGRTVDRGRSVWPTRMVPSTSAGSPFPLVEAASFSCSLGCRGVR